MNLGIFLFSFAVLAWAHGYGFVGLRGFVQGDLGLIVNVPWRILQGEIPYRDFYGGNYPPGFYYYHAALFWLFGYRVHVLAISLAIWQGVGVCLFWRLALILGPPRRAMLLTAVALLLALPSANIPFPAFYCIPLGLGALLALFRFMAGGKGVHLVLCGVLCAVAAAFKLSTGIFILLAMIGILLTWQGRQAQMRCYAACLCVFAVVLIHDRFYVSTFLVFLLPILLLSFRWWRDQKGAAAAAGWKMPLVILLGSFLVVTLLWILPFLKVLGWRDLWAHFIQFPSLQPKVLFYPPPFPGPSSWDEAIAALGFERIVQWRSLWKVWFYFPIVSAVALFPAIWKRSAKPEWQGVYIYSALMNLQMYPTIDYLHWQFAVQGAFLVWTGCSWPRKKRAMQRIAMIFTVAVGVFQVFQYSEFFMRAYQGGGFRRAWPQTLNVAYPSSQTEDLERVLADLQERLRRTTTKAWIWNPPGSLFNFLLQNPVPIATDYLGPPYFQDEEVMRLLQELEDKPPLAVVIPEVNEPFFGLSAFARHYPALYRWVVTTYPRQIRMGAYCIFEKARE